MYFVVIHLNLHLFLVTIECSCISVSYATIPVLDLQVLLDSGELCKQCLELCLCAL